MAVRLVVLPWVRLVLCPTRMCLRFASDGQFKVIMAFCRGHFQPDFGTPDRHRRLRKASSIQPCFTEAPGKTQPLLLPAQNSDPSTYQKRISSVWDHEWMHWTNSVWNTGLHDNPWLCDCQISMLMSLSMSLGSPVVLMDQLLICSRAVGQSTILLTQAQFSHCMRPSVQPAATRVISTLGSNVILRCDATGYPTPTLTWIKTSAYTGRRPGLLLCSWAVHAAVKQTIHHLICSFVQTVAKKPSLMAPSRCPGFWRVVSGVSHI